MGMKNIMLDLETMGTSSDSAIVSIGAVVFDQDLGIIDRFYKTINLQSCLDRGFIVDGGTITWWLNQSEEARKELKNSKTTIKDALKAFQDWLPKGHIQIWGNGADFDNVILQNAFKKFKVDNPWPYYANRCFRTFKYSFPTIEGIKQVGVSHKSVDDAEFQANYLIALVEKFKLKEVL